MKLKKCIILNEKTIAFIQEMQANIVCVYKNEEKKWQPWHCCGSAH